ncbi:hypothetical protein BC936DRAFT_143831 [Jimgerdemannia flammicorona]|uniref:PHD-type domain-containing protein n=1 Tax=Jimgerdemannia flammicorona TaxID=994334 RepID=A0A432ZYJ9_9FUNG|nr:hypothetical protein BC936DRAFT_143831 [Jimgerdemannia flammicorona]
MFLTHSKNGLAEEPDYARLKDKNGRVILCYKCGKSALKGPIIPCDHCTLYWHMDCLDPPMTNPPSQLKKWMCPNHVEHALPKKRKRKDTVIVDPQDPYNVPNDGNIEVVNEPEETETEGEEEKTWQRGRLEELSYGGVTYRLPERAIKLNFMESIRRLV